MSRKDNLRQFQLITNGSMTGTSVITSPVTCIQWLDNIGLQLNFTSSPVGTFQVQVSADYAQDFNGTVTNAGNWTAVPLTYFLSGTATTALTVPTSAGSPIYLDLNQLSAPWIRVVYTNASSRYT
jgi:hypothetical protein